MIPRAVAFVALLLVIGTAIIKYTSLNAFSESAQAELSQWARQLVESSYSSKQILGPVRIVYFAILLVAATLVPADPPHWLRPLFYPLRCCGRHSLVIFCLGVVLTYAAHPIIIAAHGTYTSLVACEVIGCGIHLAVAMLLSRVSAPRLQRS